MGQPQVASDLAGCEYYERLTERELQILQLVAEGQRNRDVAVCLHISIKTVEFHLSNVRAKLGVRSRTEAVVRACQLGLLDLGVRTLTTSAG